MKKAAHAPSAWSKIDGFALALHAKYAFISTKSGEKQIFTGESKLHWKNPLSSVRISRTTKSILYTPVYSRLASHTLHSTRHTITRFTNDDERKWDGWNNCGEGCSSIIKQV